MKECIRKTNAQMVEEIAKLFKYIIAPTFWYWVVAFALALGEIVIGILVADNYSSIVRNESGRYIMNPDFSPMMVLVIMVVALTAAVLTIMYALLLSNNCESGE